MATLEVLARLHLVLASSDRLEKENETMPKNHAVTLVAAFLYGLLPADRKHFLLQFSHGSC